MISSHACSATPAPLHNGFRLFARPLLGMSVLFGGEGGIRTHGTARVHRFSRPACSATPAPLRRILFFSQSLKKRPQYPTAFPFQNPSAHDQAVIQAFVFDEISQGSASPGFGIARAEDQSGQSGEHHRTCTHRTGFERGVKRAIGQPPNPQFFRGPLKNEHFGVRGGILSLNDAIVVSCDDLALAHHNRANGHFAFACCGSGFFKGEFHACQIIVLHADSKSVENNSRSQGRKYTDFATWSQPPT